MDVFSTSPLPQTPSPILLAGLFYRHRGDLVVEEQGAVNDVLAPFVGQSVHLVLHHAPQEKGSKRWGLGSCLWQPNNCPAGHHEFPERLLNFMAKGVLARNKRVWEVAGKPIPFGLVEGHFARLVLSPLPPKAPPVEQG